MKIEILKSDGTVEPYLHTKVLGTFHNALASVNDADLAVAEQMAEAVTFYVYRTGSTSRIPSDQIHLLIQSVLSSTGFDHAAQSLNEHRIQRKLSRKRITVVKSNADFSTDEQHCEPWDKSRIVGDLVDSRKMDRLTARAVAAAVEEKLLRMGVLKVRTGLLRELVAEETEAILRAEKQLQAAL